MSDITCCMSWGNMALTHRGSSQDGMVLPQAISSQPLLQLRDGSPAWERGLGTAPAEFPTLGKELLGVGDETSLLGNIHSCRVVMTCS